MWPLVAFAVLFSFGDAINSVTWALVGDCFGRRHFATIRGWISMFQSLVSMPGAVVTGWIFDRTESYTYALAGFVVCYAVSGLILCRLPQPTRRARPAASPREAPSPASD